MSSIPDSSLFDIKPATEIITAGGKRHQIVGVPFGVFLKIGQLWPSLLKLLGGGEIKPEEFKGSPEAIAEFIAAGFGLHGNQQAIDKAASLPFIEQWDLFNGILRATLGGGVGPFVERMATTVELMAKPPETKNLPNSSDENFEEPMKDGRDKSLKSSARSSSISSPAAASR